MITFRFEVGFRDARKERHLVFHRNIVLTSEGKDFHEAASKLVQHLSSVGITDIVMERWEAVKTE